MESKKSQSSSKNINNYELNGEINETINTELFEKIEKKDTPFTIIKYNEKECFVTMGKYRFGNEVTLEEAHKWVDNITWNKIVHLIITINKHKDE